ncbi:hypothetical protein [Chondromyces apiculatus]|uniref:DUF4276 family protein n=1 Tax=Chondromyces apiculatus DSM 436 TaxID=1192034 RepID=A0A017STC6_9BACT|nr:hypothetical protein [Chondromyces apiculatus]EYF00017.1 Hypothetical protein CAP_1629 [Chondromyces apiculatus DSM 436]
MTPLRIGIICEGTTDAAVLRPVLSTLLAPRDVTFALLQPDHDRLQPRTGPGWQGVRKFLNEAPEILASPLDLIVVHIDADIRIDPEIEPRLLPEPEDDDLEPLCRHVKGWMVAGVPESAVIVIPRERTESWLLAANSRRKHVEAIPNPEQYLPALGSSGKRAKSIPVYEELVKPLLPRLKKPAELRELPELARFTSKVRARVRSL